MPFERLGAMLREFACPTSLHEVRALMLGCLAFARGFPWERLHRRIWQGLDPGFPSPRHVHAYFDELGELWEFVRKRRGERPLPLERAPVRSAAEVARLARVRMEEVHAFVSGLRLMEVPGTVLPRAAASALADLSRAAGMLREVVAGAAEHGVEEGRRALGAVERLVEQSMVTILAHCGTMEREGGVLPDGQPARGGPGYVGPRTGSGGFRAAPGVVLWREADPCPCGSGYALGECCGRGRGSDARVNLTSR